jgi:hypothetical protein
VSDPVWIAVISAIGLIMSGVLVELVRARRTATKVAAEVQPNGGGSLRDIVMRTEATVDKIREGQVLHGERIAKVEAKIENWTHPARRSSDG